MDDYLTPISHIQEICRLIGIDFNKVTNVYNYGSHVHGSAAIDSDYDLLIIGDFEDPPLKFKKDDDPYYYDHSMKELKIEDRTYEILVHSTTNFEKLLEVGFLNFVEMIFNNSKFKPICEIDYRLSYLEKWYSNEKLKSALRNEMWYGCMAHRVFKRGNMPHGLDGRWTIKKMFNALRYHHLVLRFMKTKELKYDGALNDIKRSLMNRYDREGDACVNEVYNYLYDEIKKYIDEMK